MDVPSSWTIILHYHLCPRFGVHYTLILMGHSTSGVILSTVRLAADPDYQLLVAEDACTDRDLEVHRLLMEKVFPRQGTVVSSKEMVEALAAL